MIKLATPEIWFVCGSQHLYGPGPLQQVAADARDVAGGLADSPKLPLKTVFKALLTTSDEIAKLCMEADIGRELRWPHPLDAHVFALEDVDPRPQRAG